MHSGDATLVFPAQKIYFETGRRIKKISCQIAKELNISGPLNIQFLAKNNDIKVIECNLRASRSFPVRIEDPQAQLHRNGNENR